MPDTWKTGVIIPILKFDKNKFKPEEYRAITLLNTMSKILEKIINSRLSWFLEIIKFFFPKQNELRNNSCTIDSLYEIDEEIGQTFDNKQIMGLIKLDVAKTYDSTWRHNIQLNFMLRQATKYNIKFYCLSSISG